MKQNGVVCWPGPALLCFIFRFEYLILGPESYRDFRETGPWPPWVSRLQFTAAAGNFVYFKYKPFVLESCCFSLLLLFIFLFCFGFFHLHLLHTLKISTLFSTDIQLN